MNIAIFGSSRRWSSPPSDHLDEFRDFCRQVGVVLASVPHTILRVASDRDITADRWVVEGFSGAVQPPYEHRIQVYPRDGSTPFADLERTKPALVGRKVLPPARKAASAHLSMLRGADAALLVGGKDGVLNAGLAALLTHTRVWPVGYFGGGARQFFEEMRSFDEGTARIPDPREAMRFNGRPETALQAIQDAVTAFPRVMIVHGRSHDRFELVEMLTSIGVSGIDVLVDRSQPGSVIVREFERYASLSDAAIAVLTPDDVVSELFTPEGLVRAVPSPTHGRARQNVLLEYGWFWARLGRGRTLLLAKGDVEIASDLYGVKRVQYSSLSADCAEAVRDFITRVRSGSAVPD